MPHRKNMLPRVISAGGVVINRNGEILFCHPTSARWTQWSMPKGLVEPDEPIEKAALREVLEESGWKCRIIKRLETETEYRTARDGRSVMKTLVLFLMKPIAKTSEPDDEHDSFRWVPFEKVEKYASARELPLILEAIEIFRIQR
ncbi:MAG: NUDIX domain-containing protein [Bacteroidota bacterium]|nr:NUDIX domain-containing protein [Bacteroidota bacterium]MDP4233141.1 NUDIX domain-containing protein [Bacteroidota bacterium]MDP4241714.1 NUDIX domain-containing protein [Bacteroidota bacterium]MDP4287372.1 NUDIX domain-containing protein [Bacteroidota bacterium]